MVIELTRRGFARGEFIDLYGSECSIQESSLATEAALWLGINSANPQIMASQTSQGGNGWVPYSIPEEVLLTTRMHLTQDMAATLIPLLQHFVDTGELPSTDAP